MQDCALLESLESAPIHPLNGRECDRGLPKRPYNGICQELNRSTSTKRSAHSLKAMTTLVNNGPAVMYPKCLICTRKTGRAKSNTLEMLVRGWIA